MPVGELVDRAERRRAQGLGPAHRLWRDRRVRHGARRIAEDRGKRSQADGKLPPDRQGYRRASMCRSRSRALPNTAWMCRCPAWSTPRCCSRPMRAARRRRSTTRARAQVPGVTDVVKLPEGVGVIGTTRRRHAGGQEPAQGDLGRRAGRASRQRAGARGFRGDRPRQEPRRRALREQGRRQGGAGGAPSACSAANIARATSTTRRWSR